MVRLSGLTRLVLSVLILAQVALAREYLLQNWYPTYGNRLRAIVDESCQWQMALYYSDLQPANCTESTACKIAPAIDCILDEMKESDKANMAAAAVVLGLLPTTLGLAGSTTTETGMLSLRRPFLAFLLAAGAPAVNPIRTFEYRDPMTMLKARAGTWRVPHPTSASPTSRPGIWSIWTVCVQYGFAAAAVANLFWVSWTMAHKTICSWAPEIGWLPVAWAFMSVGIHIAGATAVAMRMRFVRAKEVGWWAVVRSVVRDELTPSALGSERRLQWKPEGWGFYILSWATSTGTVLHIIFGTLIFSSILFIATADAVTVAARYLASAVLCRIILNYELDGISYGAEVAIEESKPLRQQQLKPHPEGRHAEAWRMQEKRNGRWASDRMEDGARTESAVETPPLPVKRAADTSRAPAARTEQRSKGG